MRTVLLCLAVLMGGCYAYSHSHVRQPTLTGYVESKTDSAFPFASVTDVTVNTDSRDECRLHLRAAAKKDRDQGLPAPTRFQIEMMCRDGGFGFYGAYSSTLLNPIF